MKRILSILFTVICGLACLQAQTVGLVLSGGGAKGIAHIGIIKAHHGDIIRNAVALLPQRADNPHSRKVIDSDNRAGHGMIFPDKAVHCVASAFNIVAVAVHNIFFPHRNPVFT